jgi:Flp pilus assembly protein TadD
VPAAPAATAATFQPQDAQAVKALAAADKRYDAGDFTGAAAEYRRSLALKRTAPGYVGLARALYDSNQSADALAELDRAASLDPKYAQTYLLLGEIHQGEGRVDAARNAYQRFLQLQPTGDQARAVREILSKQLR